MPTNKDSWYLMMLFRNNFMKSTMKQRLLARLELSLKWRWAEIAENDVKFKRQFNKVFNNTDIKEADNGFAINLYDQYINMELTLDQGGYRP